MSENPGVTLAQNQRNQRTGLYAKIGENLRQDFFRKIEKITGDTFPQPGKPWSGFFDKFVGN
ncbi:hypothetical protein HMPREF1292_01654 [Corynebacterium sp. KPL1995]|nr:hypothetical protein HMPREF1292_01654 [Corynebacterium sp. KPL1995]ERS71820.1 hypothetical protein HMPREF1290_01660 [Corynebacterium sp. KPL1989]